MRRMERDAEEGDIGLGGMERGTPEEGGIAPGRDSVGGYY